MKNKLKMTLGLGVITLMLSVPSVSAKDDISLNELQAGIEGNNAILVRIEERQYKLVERMATVETKAVGAGVLGSALFTVASAFLLNRQPKEKNICERGN